MTQSTFTFPSQFQIQNVTMDGQDVTGLFFSLTLFEDIYRPAVTGNIVITDSDGAKFIEESRIEFLEEISFTFKDANGEMLEYTGVMNGLRNEYVDGPIKFYTVEFSSKSVRKNEQTFVVKSFKETNPEDIVDEMIQLLDGELNTQARGLQMNYLGSRRRPVDIIKYVLTHGVVQGASASESGPGQKEEEAKGNTGFLCWETVDGFNLASIDDVVKGNYGQTHSGFKTLLVNRSNNMDELMKSIVQSDFKQIGDFQTKLRSGAFGGKNVSFDMDTGEYKEFQFYNEQDMTDKQKEAFPKGSISRYFSKPIDNQKFSNECQKAQPNTGDQSRLYLEQNAGRQNTFSDQTGEFTLYPHFEFRAGDAFDCQISKVKDEESEGGYDRKHSGKYIIQQVAHHLFQDGRGYTKIKTIRSTTQQDESSS